MRTTNDPKSSIIKVRVNDSMLSRIAKEAERRGLTISQLIREAIDSYTTHP